jgi:PAS domain S-box-containing protein
MLRFLLGPDESRSWTRRLMGLGLFGLAYYLAYRFGMSFSQTVPSPFWFPDAVLLCTLLLAPPRLWWLFLAATVPIRFWLVPAERPFWFLLAAFANDSLKGLLSATILRRALRDPTRFDRLRDFGVFVAVAVIGVPILSAVGGGAAWQASGKMFWPSWQEWFLGDAMACLLLAPTILYWFFARERRKATNPRRYTEAALLIAGLAALGLAAFSGRLASPYDLLALLYAPVPFLLWAALRFGLKGTTAALTLSALFAAAAAAQGRGPFAALAPDDRILRIQLYLFLVALPVLFLAVLVGERDESLAKLKESEERYREVVNSQTDLICRFRPDTTLTFVNEAYCRYFGRPREELLGRSFLDLLPESARVATGEHVQSLVRNPRVIANEHEVLRSDGSIGWQQWLNHAVRGRDGRVMEFQGIGRDITDRKHAEDADRRLAQAGRLALMGELTASIAHEINQPLGAILSNSDALEMLFEAGRARPAEIRAILSDIRREGLRASDVIRNVRSLVRPREMQMRAVDLCELAADVLRLAEAESRRRGVALEADMASSLPRVRGDHVWLQQLLLNLMVNGMDAMSDLPQSQRYLALRASRNGGTWVEVAVEDAGHGIAAEALPRLFNSFFTTREHGMGLGLSISRSIVEAHGGRIWAENNHAGGATFRFTLPTLEAT